MVGFFIATIPVGAYIDLSGFLVCSFLRTKGVLTAVYCHPAYYRVAITGLLQLLFITVIITVII